MVDWSVAVPSFLTALVEWVEAFTIVLAVSLGIGWRGAIRPERLTKSDAVIVLEVGIRLGSLHLT